jgi:hypothetical protein
MKKIFFLVNLIIIACLLSCSKDDAPDLIQAGIQTRVYGIVTSVNGESLSDIEIRIGEYIENSSGGLGFYPQPNNYDYIFKQYVKKINLSSNGSFDFTFQTTGNGNFYKLFIGDFPEPCSGQGQIPFFTQKIDQPFGINLTSEANDMTFIGKEFLLNYVSLKKLYLCEVNVQFNLI